MVRLEELAEIIGADIAIRRYAGLAGRWTAYLERTDVMQGGHPVVTLGNGATPDEAMSNYCSQIAGKRIAVGAMCDRRHEFKVPKDLQ
jgi:hypothetical protein